MVDTSSRAIPVQFFAELAGKEAGEGFMHDLHEVTVEASLHLPAVATLVLNDAALRWIDDPRLLPGTALRILASEELQETPVFDGEIVELEPEFSASTHRLVVRAFDRLHRLTRGRQVRAYQQVTDGDLVSQLAGEAQLQAQVTDARVIHPWLLQRNQTALEFLRERASALGYLLYVRGKTLHFEPPGKGGTAVELAWGQGLREFRPRLTTLGQVEQVIVRGWDPQSRRAIVAEAKNDNGRPAIGESRPGGVLAHAAFGLPARALIADRPLRQQSEADALAEAGAARNAGAFIEAEGVCGGDSRIQPGVAVTISGVGDRFSGKYLVTSVTHRYGMAGYGTQFTVSGARATTLLGLLAAGPDGMALPAAAPRLQGLVVGIVTDNQDPEGLGRVKLKFPWLADDLASYWARIIAPGAGPDRGIQFLPEIDDEVLVGFEHGDMNHPYVLGGLWNGIDHPPIASSEAVQGGGVVKRVIRSRTGHRILIDDSPGGGGITIEDPRGNRIKLDTQQNTLTIEVAGNASIKAGGNLTLEAQGQVQLRGMGVTIDGGAATVDVRGTVINLN